MKKVYKFLLVIWIIDLILVASILGYYYGHYMNPNNVIRYVPYCKHVKAMWM